MKPKHIASAILTVIYLALGMSLVGCASVHPQIAPMVAVSNHVERAAAYADSAAASVTKSATSAAKAREAIQAAQRDVQDIKDNHNAVESLQSHLALAQQVNEDTQAAAETANRWRKQFQGKEPLPKSWMSSLAEVCTSHASSHSKSIYRIQSCALINALKLKVDAIFLHSLWPIDKETIC